MTKYIPCLLAFLLIICPPMARGNDLTGIRGRAAVTGQTLAGVKVFVYQTIDGFIQCESLRVSEPTDLEGKYSLPLSPGKYWVVGYKGGGECPLPTPGELFCFYGGNPVIVEKGKPTNVGLSLVEVMAPPAHAGEKGITGYVFDDGGEPLEGAVAYFYKGSTGGFRGIPDYFTRTNGEGRFRARIGMGKYFIVVRKRKDGELFGPTAVGDYFGYYPGNPVIYDGVAGVTLRIDAVVRLSQLEKFEGFEEVSRGVTVRGVILDEGGKAVPGYYVFAYSGSENRGMPDFISGKSDGEGHFKLTFFGSGKYTLVARMRPGGPSEDSPSGMVDIRVEEGKPLEDVTIIVRERKE